MRATKKNQQGGGQAEIIAAVKALASEKDISEEMLSVDILFIIF